MLIPQPGFSQLGCRLSLALLLPHSITSPGLGFPMCTTQGLEPLTNPLGYDCEHSPLTYTSLHLGAYMHTHTHVYTRAQLGSDPSLMNSRSAPSV